MSKEQENDTKEYELYKKYRPKTFKQIIGQEEAISTLTEMIDNNRLPQALMLVGPPGTGKTSTARIIKNKLNCHKMDFREINAADFRGIDTVREIRDLVNVSPIGSCKIWLIDESGATTRDAQTALLKLLEDTPNSPVYYILCTTDPIKHLPTILNRCTQIKFVSVQPEKIKELVNYVVEKEGAEKLSEDILFELAEAADGSPRKALVLLHKIIGLEDEQEKLNAITKSDSRRLCIELCRALINSSTKWADIAKILKNLDDEPELIRRSVLGYCRTVLLGGGKSGTRAYLIICAFESNMYDSGHAGIARACWEVTLSKD